MKILNSVIKSIGLLLLLIFVLQVGGLTCANDVYAASPSVVQGESLIKAVDLERGLDSSTSGDLLFECQCPCHLTFSSIEQATVTSYSRLESHLTHINQLSVRSLSREILQPPKILI